MQAFLAAKRGSTDIPLSYVIHDVDARTEEDMEMLMGTALKVYSTPLQGPSFKMENSIIWPNQLCKMKSP